MVSVWAAADVTDTGPMAATPQKFCADCHEGMNGRLKAAGRLYACYDTSEELDRRRRGTIGDVLADRPGISNASFGPGVGRPVIRGQGGPRVQAVIEPWLARTRLQAEYTRRPRSIGESAHLEQMLQACGDADVAVRMSRPTQNSLVAKSFAFLSMRPSTATPLK